MDDRSNAYKKITLDLASRPRRWLVTGGAGFIGSNLVEELLRLGQHVVVLDNLSTGYARNLDEALSRSGASSKRFEFIEGDIREEDACIQACNNVDYVLHQAALGSVPRSLADPLSTHQSNVNGTLNLLIAARDQGVKSLVYASSSSVYGDHPTLPKCEGIHGTPLSPYAISKRTCELYGETFNRHYDLPTVGLRYFNVFGQRQDPEGVYAAVIPCWIGSMLIGHRCEIYGDGKTTRDFCYVDNVVQANILAALKARTCGGSVFNIAFGERTSLKQLFYMIRMLLNKEGVHIQSMTPEYTDFRSGDIRHSLADISRAERELGYQPTHSLKDGLEEAIGWYVQYFQQETLTHAIS